MSELLSPHERAKAIVDGYVEAGVEGDELAALGREFIAVAGAIEERPRRVVDASPRARISMGWLVNVLLSAVQGLLAMLAPPLARRIWTSADRLRALRVQLAQPQHGVGQVRFLANTNGVSLALAFDNRSRVTLELLSITVHVLAGAELLARIELGPRGEIGSGNALEVLVEQDLSRERIERARALQRDQHEFELQLRVWRRLRSGLGYDIDPLGEPVTVAARGTVISA